MPLCKKLIVLRVLTCWAAAPSQEVSWEPQPPQPSDQGGCEGHQSHPIWKNKHIPIHQPIG